MKSIISNAVFVILLQIFMLPTAAGQIVEDEGREREIYFATVKLVDEFMERFNGNEFAKGIDTTKSNRRELGIISLFDKTMFNATDDSVFAAAKVFATSAAEKNIKINYEDTTWFAIASCKGKFKSKPIDFTLWLQVENRREDMYKWVIVRAYSEQFQLKASDDDDMIMIQPNDHEVNFSALNVITNGNDKLITKYMRKGYEIDQTSVFLALVNTGLLNIDYVTDLQFVFFQVPDYMFYIRKIVRETTNSGWLINMFEKKSEIEKLKIYNYVIGKK